jgi:7,8-dihydropterin-6-yl-methyl-4-(beta-D-ribofuranosyl)aminobenzene 5'-phosphate synthase
MAALATVPPNAHAQSLRGAMDKQGDARMTEASITLTVLYNNVPHDERVTTAWGMACLVEGTGKTVLFDTGGDGRILLQNMKTLGKDPEAVDVVVLSHIHADHTGGLEKFLKQNSHVRVFLPDSFPASFKSAVKDTGAEIMAVRDPERITEGVHTTGQMGALLKEQALVVDTPKGLVVVTGCSHPGVANIATRAVEVCPDRDFYLVTGGFHLGGQGRADIEGIIKTFRKLRVHKVGPSHCTGDPAIEMFREAWGENFLDLGCGAQVRIAADRE